VVVAIIAINGEILRLTRIEALRKVNMASPEIFDANKIAHTIAALHAASWRASYRGIFSDAYLDYQVEAERLRHWQTHVPKLAEGVGEIYLATVEAEPVGFVCVEIGPEIELGAYVNNLHVLPHLHGQGLGKLLLEAAARWAERKAVTQLYLHVFEDNLKARQFYAHEGWHTVSREIEDLIGGGQAAVLKLIKPLG
jgi:GNAT superfamily N-acetyltransferase